METRGTTLGTTLGKPEGNPRETLGTALGKTLGKAWSHWEPMAANGSQWQPMTANGSHWQPMGANAILLSKSQDFARRERRRSQPATIPDISSFQGRNDLFFRNRGGF